jgi:RNA polymerase sigma factor (sigma-70 family)
VDDEPLNPELPDGVDGEEYQRIRGLMRVSVLSVGRGRGIDPWDVVDEAWSSMAAQNFERQGPFRPFAIRVARNKAIDALRRAEVKRMGPSLDAPLHHEQGEEVTRKDLLRGSEGADVDYFEHGDEIEKVELLSLVEEAVHRTLTTTERKVFLEVQFNEKSRAAVGRELAPPVTGQRVGQIMATALVKIRRHLKQHGRLTDEELEADPGEGGEGDDREQ